MSLSQEEALVLIARASVISEQETGCPAELTAAQCIFESGWLTHYFDNNCFGIKADAHGSGIQYQLTEEYINGVWENLPQAFETYASLADCFSDHARLIQNGVYKPAWEQYEQDHDLNSYIKGVAKYYATDPNYYTSIDNEANSSTLKIALQAARQLT